MKTDNGAVERLGMKNLALGAVAFASAIPIAFAIHLINRNYVGQPERAVQYTGVLFAVILGIPPLLYLLRKRRFAVPDQLGLIALATISVLLVSVYIYWVSFHVRFPADILIWSESEFVSDILKFRVGYPIYSAEVNNESFIYTPGTQLLTYFLAWLLGRTASIPVYRLIQVGYTLLATFVAFRCCLLLIETSLPAQQFRHRQLWSVVWLSVFFLIATNFRTNPFVHNLHNDGLAQLVSVIAYWLLLKYTLTRNKKILALMAVIPTVGFMVKQSVMIWAGFYCLQLCLFDRPRSIRKLIVFALAAFSAVGMVVGGCYLIWGNDFIYWVFGVTGRHGVSPLRSFQHILDVWPYFVIGLIGGFVLLNRQTVNVLFGPWLIWLILILLEAYTSGIAWMLNHLGPGCLIAGIWFVAALVKVWPSIVRISTEDLPWQSWLRTGIALAVVCLLFSGLGVVRIPIKPLSDDLYRYIKEIEREFEGQSTEEVLLDAGTWIYFKDGVIMKDRVPSIGDRGYGGVGDFSGIIGRLEQKRYAKILVRNFHSPDFHYDHRLWRQSSGIKQALIANYQEVGKIAAVSGKEYQYNTYFFDEISILVPKTN